MEKDGHGKAKEETDKGRWESPGRIRAWKRDVEKRCIRRKQTSLFV